MLIDHSASTYWTKKDSEKAEIFRKIEPYLTFLNIPQLERRRAEMQSKVEELEALNQALRDRDKLKRRCYCTFIRSTYDFINKITGNRKKTTTIYMTHTSLTLCFK
jgi:hypothetical protein